MFQSPQTDKSKILLSINLIGKNQCMKFDQKRKKRKRFLIKVSTFSLLIDNNYFILHGMKGTYIPVSTLVLFTSVCMHVCVSMTAIVVVS